MSKNLLFLIYVILIGTICNAEDRVVVNCSITPEIYSTIPPQNFNTSNNLRRKTGLGFFATGKVVQINGRLLDAACNPIASAIIKIWHTDNYGNYLHMNIMENERDDGDGNEHDEHFSGTGSANTDNLGYFSFITIFPGSNGDRVPHIKFIVEHRDFLDFYTEMFFSDFKENNKDPIFQQIAEDLRPLSMAYLINADLINDTYSYKYNISLNGYNRYKR